MEDISYLSLPYAEVTNQLDFFKSNLSEMRQVKSLQNSIKLLFGMTPNRMVLSVAQGQRIYKFDLYTQGVNKSIFGSIYYLPESKRLELYGENPGSPLIQWKSKRVVYQGLPEIIAAAGIDKIFGKLTNLI